MKLVCLVLFMITVISTVQPQTAEPGKYHMVGWHTPKKRLIKELASIIKKMDFFLTIFLLGA